MTDSHYKVIIISDAHLGQRFVLSDLLYEFLTRNTCDHLIINGDLIDGELLRVGWGDGVSEISRRVLDLIHARAAQGTKVTYITGNHDENLRFQKLAGQNFAGIEIQDSLDYIDPQGRKLLVIHGDSYNPPAMRKMDKAHWMYPVGNCIMAFNKVARISSQWLTGRQYSPISWVRMKLDGLLGIIGEFEKIAATQAKVRGYDGVICGHIHADALRIRDDFFYANSGDWTESATALTINHKGEWGLEDWYKKRVKLGLDVIPDANEPNPYAVFRPLTQALIDKVHRIKGPQA